MKTRKTRRKRRGLNALFCFLLAAGLMLGQFSMPTQAEESEITDLEESDETKDEDLKPDEPKEENPNLGEPEEENPGPGEPEEENPGPGEPEEENPGPGEPEEENPGPDEPGEENPGPDEPKEENPGPEKICICDSLCDGNVDDINTECLVCAENYTLCAGTVPQEDVVPINLELTPKTETDTFSYTYDKIELFYKVINNNPKQVEVIRDNSYETSLTGKFLTIPETVEYGGEPYTVVRIGKQAFQPRDYTTIKMTGVELPSSITCIDDHAFLSCTSLASINIPSRVTTIGRRAFSSCPLTSIEIPDSVTEIKDAAFAATTLKSVEIPPSITIISNDLFNGCYLLESIKLPFGITEIKTGAFSVCGSLKNIEIPPSVTTMGSCVYGDKSLESLKIPNGVRIDDTRWFFQYCTALKSVELPSSIESIDGKETFLNCTSLKILKIAVKIENDEIKPVRVKDEDIFKNATRGELFLMTPDGTQPLSGELFQKAKTAYLATEDGNTTDQLWWGWSIADPPTTDTHTVNIKVLKDDLEWTGHGKTFALRGDAPDDAYITDLTSVESGTYTVYEVDGTNYVDTRVNITVSESNKEATVNYYTATFYDGDTPYGDGTLQAPQVILKGDTVSAPLNPPHKAGFDFDKWVTTKGGSEEYKFGPDGTSVTESVGIYASWTPTQVNPEQYDVTVTIRKDNTPWGTETGNNKVFAFKKENESDYKGSYTVDAEGKFTAKLDAGNYGIYEVVDTQARTVEYRDTNVGITAKSTEAGSPAATFVDYYTATFYDRSVPYGNTTDQRPQIVLKNTGVIQPLSPRKGGYSFNGWKTELDGNIPFDFEHSSLTEPTSIYASWTTDEKKSYFIFASAEGGGSISPSGNIEVTEGTSYTFTMKADEGYRIQSVIVDEADLGARSSYTFSNVNSNHSIKAIFEKAETDPNNPGGGGGNTNPDTPSSSSSGGGNSGGSGSDSGSSSNSGSGGGNSGGGNSGSGNSGGGNSGGGGSDSGSSGGGNSGGGSDNGTNSGSSGGGESVDISAGSSLSEAGAFTDSDTTSDASGANGSRSGEPKTGDTSRLEVYALIAMITGFVYLVLYLMDSMKGMSEEEKDRLIASLLGWAKKGHAKTLRRYIALAAIFFVLAYYHAFGKRIALKWQTA